MTAMDANIRKLADILLTIKDQETMVNFLYGLLTAKEIDELSTRLKVVRMLKQGVRQTDIAKKLGVGIATVTRGSNEIKKGRFMSPDSSWRA